MIPENEALVKESPPHRLPIVELRNISRTFGEDPPVNALQDVDLLVQRGEWLAIIGPSGSGKSTLLNIIGMLDRQTGGTYQFEGVHVDELGDSSRAGLRGRRIGFVFQAFHLLPHRSVLENVMLAELYTGAPREGRRDRAFRSLDRVGLAHRAEFFPTKLSGGEKQRAAIARALMGGPSLLLCDEPTGNLDSHSADSVMEVFSHLSREGLTLTVITHNADVAKLAHRRVQIVDGILHEMSASPNGKRKRLSKNGSTKSKGRAKR